MRQWRGYLLLARCFFFYRGKPGNNYFLKILPFLIRRKNISSFLCGICSPIQERKSVLHDLSCFRIAKLGFKCCQELIIDIDADFSHSFSIKIPLRYQYTRIIFEVKRNVFFIH